MNVTFCNPTPLLINKLKFNRRLTRRLAIGGGLHDKGMALEYRAVNRI